jgi:hypothetical protein
MTPFVPMEKAKFPPPPPPVLVVIEVMLALPDTFDMVPYAHPEVVLSFPAVSRWNRHVPVMSEVWNVPPRFWPIIMAGPPILSVNVATITLMSLDTTHWKVLSPGLKSIPDRDMV